MKLKGFYLFISLIFSFGAAAGQGIKDLQNYADHLFVASRFEEALPVYQRIAYFSEHKNDPGLLLRIADCFFETGDIGRSLEYYDHSYYSQENDSLQTEILFRKATCYLKTHNYQLALIDLLSLNAPSDAWYYRKLNFFLGIAWFGCEDFTQSETCFCKSATDSTVAGQIHGLFADHKTFTRPDPKTASWLSVFFPGAGQLYAGELGEGVNSLLLTGSLVGLGILLAYYTSPLDAILTILPWFQRYYQGGIVRAGNLAKKKRAEQLSSTFDQTLILLSRSNI
jgi:tetratricopeptide (TPR) repeat protein